MTDFDDDGLDLPDDDLAGGPDLSELEAGDDELDLDLDAVDEPAARPSAVASPAPVPASC